MYRAHLHLDVRNESPGILAGRAKTRFFEPAFPDRPFIFYGKPERRPGAEYSEERIIEFIDDQILKGRPAYRLAMISFRRFPPDEVECSGGKP